MCPAPTITCNSVSGATPVKTSITTRSWNELVIPVSGTAYSPAMCKVYSATGNSATGCKYYLSSSDSNGILHLLNITSTYTDGSTIGDSVKATWSSTPKSVPASQNLNNISASADSQYIYECKGVTSSSTTGLNVQFVSTLYYLWV